MLGANHHKGTERRDMNIQTKTRTTYTVEKVLDIEPVDLSAEQRERGVYYNPQMDEAAYREARSFHNDAAAAIRAKARDERGIVAVVTAAKIG
jgi:hypothetical protein